MLNLKNSYSQLPDIFYQKINPEAYLKPELLVFNQDLASRLGISYDGLSKTDIANYLTGKDVINGSNPIALAYAGHQFGHFVPQLGDGRATLLGEIPVGDKLFDLQLKGSGRTRFSRRGDGRCSLGPAIREHLVSQYMKSLNIPTTESLAVCLTGEEVQREELHPGAVVARVASAHIRVGTFEYFYYQRDFKNLKALTDYSIERLFPDLKKEDDKYLSFFQEVSKRQLSLIAKWMSVGFIHGVMNTDNTAISGETIDFGPCAFMDTYEAEKVFSSIDRYSRYSYLNQRNIIMWNLSSLANCLVSIYEDSDQAIQSFELELSKLPNNSEEIWLKEMAKKLGIFDPNENDKEIIEEFLDYMEKNKLDFTITFKNLPNQLNSDNNIYKKIMNRLTNQSQNISDAIKLMNENNPEIIARNHHIEEAIAKSYQGDYSFVHKLAKAYASPYSVASEDNDLKEAPTAEQEVKHTFCGT
tara:strand:+ start:312 stop:1724 length:1413 start_codon:yes stop_codon:yes gene_type:complete